MRTEYRLWRKPSNRSSYEPGTLHPTADLAAAATNAPDLTSWSFGGEETTRYVDSTGGPWLITEERVPESDADKVELALDLALDGGGIDGAHHKQWSLDQIVRVLTGDRYEQVIAEYRDGEDGAETYSWDEGIAP